MPIITASSLIPSNTPPVAAAHQVEIPVQTGQVDNIEAQKVDAAPPTDPLASKLALMARKEKAHYAREKQLKEREAALLAKEAEYKSTYIPKDRLKAETLAVLTEAGITPDDLTNMFLNAPKHEELAYQNLQKEIQAIKEAQDQTQTRMEEKTKAEYDQAVKQIGYDVTLLVDENPEKYDTIKTLGMQGAVVEHIKNTFETTGKLLSNEEASDEVENYLFEEAMKMAALNKVKQKLAPQEPAQSPKLSAALKQQQQTRTLTHANSASTPRSLTAAERRNRAILAAKGQLT